MNNCRAGLKGGLGAFDLLRDRYGNRRIVGLLGSDPVIATQMMQGFAIAFSVRAWGFAP
jgi:hypothetical protein